MPKQIFSKEEFLKLLEMKKECRVVRRGDKVKLKVRTSKYLYTYVTNSKEAEEILKKAEKVIEY